MKNEINDLLDYNYKILQNPEYFKFSLDSVMLAEFVKPKLTDKKMLDLCTGNAPIPIILSKIIPQIYGIELQKEIYDLAIASINLNKIKNIKIINDDAKNSLKYFNTNEFDIITCNPPYFKSTNSSIKNKNMIKSIARHEIYIKLEEIIAISQKLLKVHGRLFIVHRSERLIELIELLNNYRFGIKKMEFIYNNLNSECSMVLVEAMKDGKNDIKISRPIIVESYRR